jgi:uncharacterized surface protein with fasciclin (FAS1) repeats
MKKNLWLNKIGILCILFSILIVSCNKDVDAPVPNTFELPKGATIGVTLSNDPAYSLLLALVNKVGLTSALLDSSKIFTVFAPDNTAIKNFVSAVSGGLIPPNAPDQVFAGFIGSADPNTTALLRSIVNYHILPGLVLKSSSIGDGFSNTQYPTGLVFPTPNTNPLVRFTNFVSRRQSSHWINNIPVSKPDYKIVSNGLIHGIAAVLVPPTRLLLDTISRDADFTYLVAAIKRADSGLVTTKSPSFQYFLGEPTIAPAANFTVFAPTDQAFKDLIDTLVYKKVFALTQNDSIAKSEANKAKAAGPVFLNTNNITTLEVRGIIAHHVIASKRAFTVNFPQTASNFTTLYNGSVPNDKGLEIKSTLNEARFGVALSVKGSAALPEDAPAVAQPTPLGVDRHAVNGVFYKINKVLVPKPPTP